MDIRNLGVFANIDAVWSAYSNGGREGDYLYIGADEATGTKYRWNKYILKWENAEVVTETPAREMKTIDGDLTINNDLFVAGKIHGGGLQDGKSAYELAVKNGFKGTETEWLASLVGKDGDDGKSAYEIAVANGFEGSEETWLASLKEASDYTHETVASRPSTGEPNIIYAIPGTESWTEEIYVNGSWVVLATHSGTMAEVDATPTEGSTHAVQSGGVYSILHGQEQNYVDGFYIANTGEAVADESYCYCDYIPAVKNDVIEWHFGTTQLPIYVGLYNANHVKVDNYSGNVESASSGTRTFTITSAYSVYMRCSFSLADIDNCYVKKNGVIVWSPKHKVKSILEDMPIDSIPTKGSGRAVSGNGIYEQIDQIAPKASNYISGYVPVTSTGVLSQEASYGFSDYIPIKAGDTIEWLYDTTSNTYARAILYDANYTYLGYYQGTSNTGIRTITLSKANLAYIRVGFKKTSYAAAYLKVNGTLVWSPQLSLTKDWNLIRPTMDSLGYTSSEYGVMVRNGSQGSAGNNNVVTICGGADAPGLVIPVKEGHSYRLFVARPNTEGYQYFYNFYTYNTTTPPTLYDVASRIRISDTYNLPISTPVTIKTGELAISLVLCEKTEANGTYHAIRYSDFLNDWNNNMIRLVDVTNNILEQMRQYLPSIQSVLADDIYKRNADKLPMLYNACRWRKDSATFKDFQCLICTDSHGDSLSVDNAVEAANKFETVDALMHLGDYQQGYYSPAGVVAYQADVAASKKPFFFVIGNHDVGNNAYVGLCCDHSEAYTAYIEPLINAGHIADTGGKCYYYVDNPTFKLRIIALYEWDEDIQFDEEYWAPITYDSTLPNIAPNTSYAVGDKVNAGVFANYGHNYTSYSFQCAKACTISTTPYNSVAYLPKYKMARGYRVIRQEQAQWFLDTLASTPANYGVLVLTHNPYGQTIVSQDLPFNYIAGRLGSAAAQDYMQTNFIQEAIAAFKMGTNYSANIVMKSGAAYMNIQGGNTYAYSVSKDFSAKNSGVWVAGVLGGHVHSDKVYKDETNIVYSINPACAATDVSNAKNGDIRRTATDGIAYDCLTVVSIANGRIGLVKLGVNVTENGVKRDYMVINAAI
ncbi:MAG: metallophosphoesterase [Bacteroidaceae bacterium]|nr:metallophosphoesterase [Bacteroidaceae bacterium]